MPIYNVEEYAHIYNQGGAYLHCGGICSYIKSGVCLFTFWRNMLIYIIRGVPIYIVEEFAHIYNQGCVYLHCGGICSYK